MKAATGPLFRQIQDTEEGRRLVREMIDRVRQASGGATSAPAAAASEPFLVPGVGRFRIGRIRRG
jgi:hypothetical protein